jgi:hypothetical protein
MSQLPSFLLADSLEFPDSIFVIHTEFPRFIIDLSTDELTWWERFASNDKEEATSEIALWIEKATAFYDAQIKEFENE